MKQSPLILSLMFAAVAVGAILTVLVRDCLAASNPFARERCFHYVDTLTEICTSCKSADPESCKKYYKTLFACEDIEKIAEPEQLNMKCLPALKGIKCDQVTDNLRWLPASCPMPNGFMASYDVKLEKAAKRQRFKFPGWEDVVISFPFDHLVGDLAGNCHDSLKQDEDPNHLWQACKVCRSADSLLPCVEIKLEGTNVALLSTGAPVSKKAQLIQKRLTSFIEKNWGKPNTRVTNSTAFGMSTTQTWRHEGITAIVDSLAGMIIARTSDEADVPSPGPVKKALPLHKRILTEALARQAYKLPGWEDVPAYPVFPQRPGMTIVGHAQATE